MPLRDDRALFELLILEGAQAGLSRSIVLKKRENYRRAFEGFEPERIGGYDDEKVASLLADTGVIRNRAKIAATIQNARSSLVLTTDGRSFSEFLWQFVGGVPIRNRWVSLAELLARTQAAGMVSDHLVTCPRHTEANGLRRS